MLLSNRPLDVKHILCFNGEYFRPYWRVDPQYNICTFIQGPGDRPQEIAGALVAGHIEEAIKPVETMTTNCAGLTPLQPGKTDVLLGRGRGRWMHVGNLRYEGAYRLQ